MVFERKFDDAEITDLKSVVTSSKRIKMQNILLIKFFPHKRNFSQARQEEFRKQKEGMQIPSNIQCMLMKESKEMI